MARPAKDPNAMPILKNATERVFNWLAYNYGVQLERHPLGYVQAVDTFDSIASGFVTRHTVYRKADEATRAFLAWLAGSQPETLATLVQAVAEARKASEGEIVAVQSDEDEDEDASDDEDEDEA